MSDPIATTTEGRVRGTSTGGVCRFYGIPYAAAPVGALRFAKPVPHAVWTGERPAIEKAPNAPQTIRAFPGMDTTPFIGTGWRKGEDFLIANVWTPDPDAHGLPVMVFIHGGAWIAGTSDCPAYDGASFASKGIVCITINYRMGVEGFLPADGVPANLGLHDMIAALRWVQNNAMNFGGDAGNVTVFGESAGAMSIANLIASPLGNGLFRRAIVQSGHGSMLRRTRSARVVANRIAEILGVAPSRDGLCSASMEACTAAVETISQPASGLDLREDNGKDPTFGLSRFLPFVGDEVVPEPTLDALAKGAGREIDVLIGSNTEEMNIYFVPTGVSELDDANTVSVLIDALMPRGSEALADYGLGHSGKPGQVLTRALSDLVFRDPVRAFAEAHQGRTHVYEFGWRSPAFAGKLGACHALELPFVFNTLASCTGPQGFVGENPPQALADHTHAVWAAFVKDGTLPWDAFDRETRQVYRLDKAAATREEVMPAAKYRLPV